jgi:hypothetical protein
MSMFYDNDLAVQLPASPHCCHDDVDDLEFLLFSVVRNLNVLSWPPMSKYIYTLYDISEFR